MPLIAAAVMTWPLVQRALTDEPSITSEPPGWRARAVAPELWVAAPLVLLTALQIPMGPATLDLPSLVLPLAIFFGWRFGLRGFRTTVLMVLPALTALWPTVSLHLTLDLAATALLLAALFARPGLFAQMRNTSQLPVLAVGALGLLLSCQIFSAESWTSGLTATLGDSSSLSASAPHGWAPATFVVLALFLLAGTQHRGQAGVILAMVGVAGVASLAFEAAGITRDAQRTGLMLPLSANVAVAGLIAYGVGRYHERVCRALSLARDARSPVRDFGAAAVLIVGTLFAGLFIPFPGYSSPAFVALAAVLAWTAGVRAGDRGIVFGTGIAALASIGLIILTQSPNLPGPSAGIFAPFLPLLFFVVARRCRSVVIQSTSGWDALTKAPNWPAKFVKQNTWVAIGILGAVLTSVLSQVPVASGLGQVLAILTPAVGLVPSPCPSSSGS